MPCYQVSRVYLHQCESQHETVRAAPGLFLLNLISARHGLHHARLRALLAGPHAALLACCAPSAITSHHQAPPCRLALCKQGCSSLDARWRQKRTAPTPTPHRESPFLHLRLPCTARTASHAGDVNRIKLPLERHQACALTSTPQNVAFLTAALQGY